MKLIEAIVQNHNVMKSLGTRPKDPDSARVYGRQDRIEECLPHGSGFDAGTRVESVTNNKIVFLTEFHHMDKHGSYCGWTQHKVIVEASLVGGYSIRVTGRDRNMIKDYIANHFHCTLDCDFDWMDEKDKS